MKVAFYTLGCKVNQYETDLMMKSFVDAGYEIVDVKEMADIYVVNSCSVTNLSTRKTRQLLSRAKATGGIVVLVGCYAQEIKDRCDIKNADIVLGNEEKKDIVTCVEKYLEHSKRHMQSNYYKISDIGSIKKYVQKDMLTKGINVRESIKIEDGCNNFCSYCIIPYVRGRVRSRSLESIVAEVKSLVASGVGEVVLVGIEIASYGKDLEENLSLIDVIEQVANVKGLQRVRLGSLEPRVLTDEVIERLSRISNLCPHFHLSVQSLDNQVLQNMNRKYTREDVFSIVEKMKACIKNISFTCDIIVGFPGETEEEFMHTMEGVKRIGFYELHVFKYSKRKWTRAEKMKDQVDGNVANERSEKLIALGESLKKSYLTSYLGKRLPVLFESYKAGYLYGYTPNYIKVKVRGDRKLWGCQSEIELVSIEDETVLGNICP